MSRKFYTSDTHFGHENIIKYCNRPFKNAHDMNMEMIYRWNTTVKNGDEVFIAGDFVFGNAQEAETILAQLNGTKHLILGNHDRHIDYYKVRGLKSVSHIKTLKDNGQNIIICHYAMRVWDRSHHGSIMLYGHTHGTLPGNSQSLDIGVDTWDYTPINIDQINARLAQLPKYEPI